MFQALAVRESESLMVESYKVVEQSYKVVKVTVLEKIMDWSAVKE